MKKYLIKLSAISFAAVMSVCALTACGTSAEPDTQQKQDADTSAKSGAGEEKPADGTENGEVPKNETK